MRILCLGAHADDLEFGMGGTITKLAKKHEVFTAIARECNGKRLEEQRKSNKILGIDKKHMYVSDFEFSSGEKEMQEIACVSRLIKGIKPDRVYIPWDKDSNQHHRRLAMYCMSALRRTNISCYMYHIDTIQGIKTEMFKPHIYEDITKEFKKKIKALKCHKSQLGRLCKNNVKFIKDKDSHDGFQAGVKYAETFRILREVRK